MKRIFPLGLFVLFFLAACAGPTANQPATAIEKPLDITVFRTPT